MWRSSQKSEAGVSSPVLMAAEYFMRPHTLAQATGFLFMHPSHQSILHLRPLLELMSVRFLGPQGGPGEFPPSLLVSTQS